MNAVSVLNQAASLVGGDRDRVHGDKHETFEKIATLWNAWLQVRSEPAAPLNAHDVAQMMSLMKKARTQNGARNGDDYVDDAGYSACAGELA